MKTPVLYCIFNRLDVVKKTFEPIRAAQPERLYIAADGPRLDKPGEKELTEKVRKYVLDNVDWDCDVKTLFRDKNVGCDLAMSGAVEWFFSQEKEGIIVEEDILTSAQFFEFCELMLNRYRDNPKVRCISGFNQISDKYAFEDYHFIPVGHIWGWATWRSALYPDNGLVYKYYPNNYYSRSCNRAFVLNQITSRKDFQKSMSVDFFSESRWENNLALYWLINNPNSYTILPNKNLTSHIGDVGFHFSGQNNWNIPIETFDINKLKINKTPVSDIEYSDMFWEEYLFKSCFQKYGRENIDVKAVKQDYYKIKADIITSFLKWFYYRYIKFMKKRAKTIHELYLHNKYLLTTIEPFYIYTKYYYKKS